MKPPEVTRGKLNLPLTSKMSRVQFTHTTYAPFSRISCELIEEGGIEDE